MCTYCYKHETINIRLFFYDKEIFFNLKRKASATPPARQEQQRMPGEDKIPLCIGRRATYAQGKGSV